MKTVKLIIFMCTILPIVFISAVLGGPFYALCVWAGERDIFDSMLDRVGDRLKSACIEFVTSEEK